MVLFHCEDLSRGKPSFTSMPSIISIWYTYKISVLSRLPSAKMQASFISGTRLALIFVYYKLHFKWCFRSFQISLHYQDCAVFTRQILTLSQVFLLKDRYPFKRAKNHLIGAVGHERITSKGKNRKVKTPSHGSTISCHVGNGWWGMAGWMDGWMASGMPRLFIFKNDMSSPWGTWLGRGWNWKFQRSSWIELRRSRASSFVTHPSNSTRRGSIWTIHYNSSTWTFRSFCLGFLY